MAVLPGPPPFDVPMYRGPRMHPLWKGWFLQIWKQGGTSGAGGTGVNQIVAGANINVVPAGGVGVVTVSGTDAPEVNQIIAGQNISISPAGGTGTVTINSAPASGFFAMDGADADDLLHIPGPAGASGIAGPQGIPGIGLDGADADDLLHIPGQTGSPGPVGPQGIPGIAFDGLDGDEGMSIPGASAPVLGFSGGLVANTTINDTVTYITGGITLANQIAIAGSVWRVRANGQFVAATSITARNAQVACFWGATQLVAITAAVLVSTAQTTNFQLDFVLTGVDTTHIWTTGFLISEIASATALAMGTAAPASTAVTTGNQTLDLRFSMSVAIATDQWVVHQVTMQRLK